MNGTDIAELEDRLWSAADELRANSKLRASEYSTPVLGLIFFSGMQTTGLLKQKKN